MKTVAHVLLAFAVVLVCAAPAHAGTVAKKVPFQLEQWIPLEATDGPVTLHRIRLVKQGESLKSRVMRPNNSEYLQDVQIQIEYSNTSSNDWKARLEFRWLDGDGKVIDGYNNEEGLDDSKRHDEQTVTLSTLKYGLDRARTLDIKIEFYPD